LEIEQAMIKNLAQLLAVITLSCAAASATQIFAQATPTTSDTESVSTATAQTAAPREFRFLATNKVATMEKELNELAAEGYRLDRVSRGVLNKDLAVIVTRDPSMTNAARYEYKLIATRRAGTMEKELLEAAAQGYELRGMISLFRLGLSSFAGDETAAMLERPAGEAARRFDYKLISTRREKTTQNELDAAVSEGYVPVDIVRGQDNGAASILLGPQFVITIIVGRPVGSLETARAVTRDFKFLTTTRVATMEKEMNAATKEGYRYYMSGSDILMLMSRERGMKDASPYQYKLLATRRTGTMQKELLEQGMLGYKYLATTSGLGGLSTVLERDGRVDPKENRREYKLLAVSREKTAKKEIAETLAAGYKILDLTTIGEFIIVLDRQAESGATAIVK
jgi:hypothetical protein